MRRKNLGNVMVKRAIVFAMAFMMGITTVGTQVITARAEETVGVETTADTKATEEDSFKKAVETAKDATDGVAEAVEIPGIDQENAEAGMSIDSKDASASLTAAEKNYEEAKKQESAVTDAEAAYNKAVAGSTTITGGISDATAAAEKTYTNGTTDVDGAITTAQELIDKKLIKSESDASKAKSDLLEAADTAETQLKDANAALDEAEAALKKAEEDYNKAVESAKSDYDTKLAAYKAEVEAAEANLAAAQKSAEHAVKRIAAIDELLASVDAVITSEVKKTVEQAKADAELAVADFASALDITDEAADELKAKVDAVNKEYQAVLDYSDEFDEKIAAVTASRVNTSNFIRSYMKENNTTYLGPLLFSAGQQFSFECEALNGYATEMLAKSEVTADDKAEFVGDVKEFTAAMNSLNDALQKADRETAIAAANTIYKMYGYTEKDLTYTRQCGIESNRIEDLVDAALKAEGTSELDAKLAELWMEGIKANAEAMDASYRMMESVVDLLVASDDLDAYNETKKVAATEKALAEAFLASLAADPTYSYYSKYTDTTLKYIAENYQGYMKTQVEEAKTKVDAAAAAFNAVSFGALDATAYAEAQTALTNAFATFNETKAKQQTLVDTIEKARSLADGIVYKKPASNNPSNGGDTTPTNPTTPTTPVVTPTTPAAPAARTVVRNAANNANAAAVADAADDNTVAIADTETPLDGGDVVEEPVEEEVVEETVGIEDPEVPEASEVKKISWWWLLILAILAACGITGYEINKKKKASKVEE